MVKPYLRRENFLSYSLVFLLSLVGLAACSQTTSLSQTSLGTNLLKLAFLFPSQATFLPMVRLSSRAISSAGFGEPTWWSAWS